MYGVHDSANDLFVESVLSRPLEAAVEHFGVAFLLEDGHVVLALEGAYPAADLHALEEQEEKRVVGLVELLAERGEFFTHKGYDHSVWRV